jgi:hypothetical protein
MIPPSAPTTNMFPFKAESNPSISNKLTCANVVTPLPKKWLPDDAVGEDSANA